jgi:diguanylate cyclase (GGDEF)-like protein
MALEPATVIDRTRSDLRIYSRALGHGVDSDQAVHAGWQLHRDLDTLLPLTEQLLAERDALAELLQLARRDPLTGLDTRSAWTAKAEQMVATGTAVVLLLDLDAFKKTNDTLGHAAGDAVLVATAARLADWCGPAGHAGRLGGDEFVAAVPDHGDLTERVGKLGAALSRPVEHHGQLLAVSVSIGGVRVAELPPATLSQALAAADQAMYETKRRGRRGRRFPTPLNRAHSLRRRTAEPAAGLPRAA